MRLEMPVGKLRADEVAGVVEHALARAASQLGAADGGHVPHASAEAPVPTSGLLEHAIGDAVRDAVARAVPESRP